MMDFTGQGPLAGLRVLDIATIIAGPMAATLMADFGAEVVKLELPGVGDGLRGFPPFREGKSLWWKVTNRGKYFGTLDLRTDEGTELFLRMVAKSDVVIENFRPGTLERWGLDIETLWKANPRLVVLRVSGFGQDGPNLRIAGFCADFRSHGRTDRISGTPDSRPCTRAIRSAIRSAGCSAPSRSWPRSGAWRRATAKRARKSTCRLTEAMFRIIEVLAIEYDQLGEVRQRSGNRNLYSAPSDVYLTADKRYVSLAGSTNRTFANNARAIGRPELADDPRFATNAARVENASELDRIFGGWIAAHTQEEAVTAFRKASGTLAPIYSVDQIFEDPQFVARGAIAEVTDEDFGRVRMQGLGAALQAKPGQNSLGREEYRQPTMIISIKNLLGLDDTEIERYKAKGVI